MSNNLKIQMYAIISHCGYLTFRYQIFNEYIWEQTSINYVKRKERYLQCVKVAYIIEISDFLLHTAESHFLCFVHSKSRGKMKSTTHWNGTLFSIWGLFVNVFSIFLRSVNRFDLPRVKCFWFFGACIINAELHMSWWV